MVLESLVSTKQDAVAPSWNPVLLGRIIDLTVLVVLIRWIEVQRPFVEPTEHLVLRCHFNQLVVILQGFVLARLNESPHVFITPINAEVHVSEEALVVVVALLPRAYDLEVFVRLLVDGGCIVQSSLQSRLA